ncbi:glycosyltransferase [Salinibacterium sp. NK8237]|uniref:glycosyltransferase family 2 protein n=1 Tax=Salinibacterium sp. NK8237 TaxID=2792038 RepID=UPI0018CF1957|nr:glycosyltransferase [Salinibacterium sp. NK8237]MBH0131073.1 glycosyltransferase family 2 protein [Salinibacterium sp. NK8237]
MITFIVAVLLIVGVNTLVWTTAGLARVATSWLHRWRPRPRGSLPTRDDVAVIIAAHNEELVIGTTISSAASLIPASHIFVVSDGSTDSTCDIAMDAGATVLDLRPNRGKAGALSMLIREFDLASQFEVVMVLDADTQLAPDYFDTGLPLFSDDNVVAVAGMATSLPEVADTSLIGRILVAYRERVYVTMQYLHKFGQAARGANVVSIVPGFASMYRSRILSEIDIDAPGLTIEDYNMTFEVHAKKLGRIAFHPTAAIALTQDPATMNDYTKQVSRWNLGLWQTVRRHGIHRGNFWAALYFFVTELVLSSVMMLLLVPLAVSLLALTVIDALDGEQPTFASAVVLLIPPLALLCGVLIPDYLMTIFAAVVSRKPWMLVLGFAFIALRIVDAFLCLRALRRAWGHATSGSWASPSRRAVTTEVAAVRT